MHSFFWLLYLTINAPDFRLIPLDRTHIQRKEKEVSYLHYHYLKYIYPHIASLQNNYDLYNMMLNGGH